MDQAQLTALICERPENYAWFLGAGSSRSAGLPTATDLLWDMKRRYYCREENQEISHQDMQLGPVQEKIQSYLISRGFPPLWDDDEYSLCFEKIFGEDRELQRRYLKAKLSEDNVSLSVGHRVFGAMLSSGMTRAVFTTNFDSVVEKAVAEVGSKSLSAFHLEGSHSANEALNNEEYPIYCKLHGDFRYDSLKNLSADLASQNEHLSRCFVNASSRFGFVVSGYSGRDESIMALFRSALDGTNPFPHGFFWTGMKGSSPLPAVQELLDLATSKGIAAHYVPVETFDSLLSRIWRNIEDKPTELDTKVRKSIATSVSIPLPKAGTEKPLIRFNALPISALPATCLSLNFRSQKEWADLRKAQGDTEGKLIFTKADKVWCWGKRSDVEEHFGQEIASISTVELPSDPTLPENLHLKGFLEAALCKALAKDKPLLSRSTRYASWLIVDPHSDNLDQLAPLRAVVGNYAAKVSGQFTEVTEQHPIASQVTWAEAARISLELKNGQAWLQIDPDIWVWPNRARRDVRQILDNRRKDRYNPKFNEMLDAWVRISLGTTDRRTEVELSTFEDGDDAENPVFTIGTRTAFSKRVI
jgi:hypothetical protein